MVTGSGRKRGAGGPPRALAEGPDGRRLEEVPEVRRVKGHEVSVGRLESDCFVTSSVPLSCRILSKLSQEINKNEERRSIFAPRK